MSAIDNKPIQPSYLKLISFAKYFQEAEKEKEDIRSGKPTKSLAERAEDANAAKQNKVSQDKKEKEKENYQKLLKVKLEMLLKEKVDESVSKLFQQ